MLSRKFICAGEGVCDYETPVAAPLFRKTFILENIPKTASFTLCGLGLYELYINGKRITKGALAPYIYNPDDLLYFDEYDIKPHLREGENVIGIMLGNGFFNCFGGVEWDFHTAAWRGPLRLAFALELDGQCIEADESVKVSRSALLLDDLRIGAFYDARLEQDGWCDIGFCDDEWQNAVGVDAPKGKPTLCFADAVVAYREIEPVSITHCDEVYYACESAATYERPIERTRVENAYVYDFAENNSGVCRLKIKGERGQEVTLRFGECLIDGHFSLRSTVNMGTGKDKNLYLDYPQMDKYILRGGEEEIFLPPFTYHGFRYVLVEGIKEEQATKDLLTYVVMGSDIEKRAKFSCSDEILNKLYDMTCRSDRSNLLYVPTDCPHREKNGWTADISLSSEHILLSFSAEKTFSEWLKNVRAAQRDGAFPGIIPTAGWGFEWGNGPAWDSVCVYMPYYLYKYSGDKTVIADNLPSIMDYLRYIATRRDERGLIAVGLIDWAQPFYNVTTTLSPLVFTDSAIIFDMAQKTAFLAREIDENDLACEAEAFAGEMKAAIRTHLIDLGTMTAEGACQTSQSLALEFGLFEENEQKAAADRLVDFVHSAEDHLLCGVIGARFVFHSLVRFGHAELALKMIENPTYPSYAQWVARGDTTLSEGFVRDGVGERGGRDSRNHHFWGDISSLFIRKIAGLSPNPKVTDINEYLIAPQFVSTLSFAQAEYRDVSVRWEREKDGIILKVSVPPTAHGRIKLPQGYAFSDGKNERTLASGEYKIM